VHLVQDGTVNKGKGCATQDTEYQSFSLLGYCILFDSWLIFSLGARSTVKAIFTWQNENYAPLQLHWKKCPVI
jgi:hypothetical protein